MRRRLHRLTVKEVANKRQPGYYGDGNGLHLQVTSSGAKSWIFRFMLNGREREMGLGSHEDISLAEARERAAENHKLVRDQKIDPIEARKANKLKEVLAAAKAMTFSECAKKFIEANRAGWKNEKHVAQWENTLTTYCEPSFGEVAIEQVDTALVLKALEPIWSSKPETATRVRGRIERVIDWATARKYRSGENPARWRGHLDKILPTLGKKNRVKHHPALPFDKVGSFMADLRNEEGIAARALEFVILTAGRTGEVVGAKWQEVDIESAVWTVPASRMKANREHRVPLSQGAIKLLKDLKKKSRPGDFIFPGPRVDTPLSNMAMLALLDRMKRGDITVHGFRSTFRDWAAENTNYPREVCEMALAHTLSDKVEAAYRRGDLFEKRRRLMADWAKHCETPTAARA